MDDARDYAALIEEAKCGSDDALGRLIESVRTYLLLVANRALEPQLRQKVAASDIVQDVCMLASERFQSFRGSSEGELKVWLRQVLLNSIADSRRRFVQSQKRQASLEIPIDADIGVPVQQATPRTSMIAKEEAGLLTSAMRRLPEDYQLVLRLRNWELLSFAAIAERMNRSDDATQKLWTRAVRALERELG